MLRVHVWLRFRLYAFVEAAALRSIVLRYTGATIATRVPPPSFIYLEVSFFQVFCVPLPFSRKVRRTFFPFRMAFLYLCVGARALKFAQLYRCAVEMYQV